jgi:transcriptional regulator GlxA family with amidase domain
MAHSIAALVLPGVVTFDLGCVLQIFGAGTGRDPGYYDLVVCAPRCGRVQTADGFAIHVDHGLPELLRADTVLVVGYAGFIDQPPPAAVLAALRQVADRGGRVGSVCVGTFALGHAGLLDGRRCTTHWVAADALALQFPEADVAPNVLYVEDGPILTSAGAAAGLDLGLHIVRRDYGAEAAAELARWGVVAPHRDGGQAQFIRRPVSSESGTNTAAVREWALEHLDQPLTVADLAAHGSCGERTLSRRFVAETGQTPKQWLITARLQRARELLETTDLSVDRVAQNAGFPSPSALRDCFAGALSTTPTAYRRTFASEKDISVLSESSLGRRAGRARQRYA